MEEDIKEKLMTYFAGGVIALGIISLPFVKKHDGARLSDIETLISKSIDKASGEDGFLDSREGAALARELGYIGALHPEDKVDLRISYGVLAEKIPCAHLYINNQRCPECINKNKLKDYANRE